MTLEDRAEHLTPGWNRKVPPCAPVESEVRPIVLSDLVNGLGLVGVLR